MFNILFAEPIQEFAILRSIGFLIFDHCSSNNWECNWSTAIINTLITEPKNAIIKQYIKLFGMDDIALSFEEEALNFIVEKALEYKLGARGLRSLCESILTDAMFQLPGTEEKSLVVTRAYAQEKLTKSGFTQHLLTA